MQTTEVRDDPADADPCTSGATTGTRRCRRCDTYAHDPPDLGPAQPDAARRPASTTRRPPIDQAIHSLEHGGTILWYSPDAPDSAGPGDHATSTGGALRRGRRSGPADRGPVRLPGPGRRRARSPPACRWPSSPGTACSSCDQVNLAAAFDFTSQYACHDRRPRVRGRGARARRLDVGMAKKKRKPRNRTPRLGPARRDGHRHGRRASRRRRPRSAATRRSGRARRARPSGKRRARTATLRRAAVFVAGRGSRPFGTLWWLQRAARPGRSRRPPCSAASAAGCTTPSRAARRRPGRTAPRSRARPHTYDAASRRPRDRTTRPRSPTHRTSTRSPCPRPQAVHSLEHAGVILYYRSDGDGALPGRRRRRAHAGRRTARRTRSSRPTTSSPREPSLALAAWNKLQTCPGTITAARPTASRRGSSTPSCAPTSRRSPTRRRTAERHGSADRARAAVGAAMIVPCWKVGRRPAPDVVHAGRGEPEGARSRPRARGTRRAPAPTARRAPVGPTSVDPAAARRAAPQRPGVPGHVAAPRRWAGRASRPCRRPPGTRA